MCAFLGTKMGIFRKCLELSKMVRNAKIIDLTQSLIVSHNDQILVSDSIPVSHSIQYEILLACLVETIDYLKGLNYEPQKDTIESFENVEIFQKSIPNVHMYLSNLVYAYLALNNFQIWKINGSMLISTCFQSCHGTWGPLLKTKLKTISYFF